MNVRKAKSGTSINAICRAIVPIVIGGAGISIATPLQAQTSCLPIVGIDIVCGGGGAPADPAIPVLNLPPIVGPVTVVLGDGFQSPRTVNLTTLGAAADVTIDAVGSAVIDTVGEPGLTVDSAGAITARITAISTAGDGASGAILRAVDDVIFTVDDLVTTTGDNAPGIDIQGSSVTLNSNIIRTSGDNSNGVQLVSLDGPVNLDGNLIETNGDLSTAALVRAAGDVNVNVGVLQTQGSRAIGLDIATDPAACVLLGTGGCDVTAAADRITTNGFGGIGALVSGATGVTTINLDVLETNGDEAAGLNLSADPVVCATLGAGACDQNFTVGSLTTQGDNSPGALVRAAGNITGSVNVLTTNGNDAFGLDLASDPDACVLLGDGNCGTAFNVGQLTTSGDGATGVLARVAGPTTGRVGLLETSGDNATGIDIAGDPTACVLLGSGACDVDLAADQVRTQGDGAAGVLIDAPANILANIGLISTSGDNATGLGITTDPTLCLILGPGSCGITAVTGPVDTDGDNSPGVEVDGGDDPIDVTTGPVTTGGDNSPGVDVSGNGPITVVTGPVTTTGDDSPGVIVDGGAGPVVVTTTNGPITTGGSNSDGIVVTTTTGDQTIVAGPVIVTGPGSDGIVATSPGCSAIDITATGPVTSAQGTAILASSACSVTVTTLAGAPVSGGVAGIDVTSGTGATITIGDAVSSAAGPAIDIDGASALVTIASTGTVNGYVDLTDSDDRLVNNGTFNATANSNFGAGNDSIVNTGVFAVRPTATTAGGVTLTGLESFANSGRIDLRNGHTGDTLTLPGSFTGTGNSTLAVDVSLTTAGSTADRLVIGGAATGSTTIVANPLVANPGVLVNNLELVDAGAGSSSTAFSLGGGVPVAGLVSYQLVYDAAGSNYALYGTPSNQAYEFVKANEGARQIFYRTNDAWSGHMRDLRDAGAGTATDESRRGSALWGQMFGSFNKSRSRQDVSVFGQAKNVVTDNRQDFFGGQIGYDFGGVSGSQGIVFGITGGYASSTVIFSGNADRFDFDAANGGVYASLNAGPVFVNLLAKYEHYWGTAVFTGVGPRRKFDGDGYGGKAEAGIRFGGSGFYLEPNASVEYVRTDLGSLSYDPTTIDFGRTDGLRSTAGLRLGTELTSGTTRTSLYAGGSAVHEFKGRDGPDFLNSGQSLAFRNDRIGTYGHGVIGVNIVSNGRVSGFIEASGDYSKSYKGGGGRAGLSIRF